MARARDEEHGQLISNSSDSPKPGISAHIGEAQGSSLQPGNPWVEVTVLRAHGLPRLKTLFGKKRQFYVTVTDGMIAKETTAIRSVERAVEWNEKLDPFPPSSDIILALYAKRKFYKDILVGTYEIPLKPQRDVAVVLSKGEGSPSRSATLHLTVALSANPCSSTTMTDDTPIPMTTGVDNRPAEKATAPSVALHTVESSLATAVPASKPLSPSTDYLAVETGAAVPPTADCKADMSPTKKALHDADGAMKTMDIYSSRENALTRIRWVMDTVSPVAELHPYAKMAWSLLSMIPKAFLTQDQRDRQIQALLNAMHDAFDFTQVADPLKSVTLQSKKGHILMLMLRHVCCCSDFIQSYTQDIQFRKRLLKNISGQADQRIEDLCTTFVELRKAFLDRAIVTTEITVLQILDDVGVISTHLDGMATQLKGVSSQVSDLDLDEKLREIPYKGVWRSNIQRDYLPGTRTDFLKHIVEWVDHPDSKRGLVLFGQAGTGKSSIAHEVAQRFRAMGRLSSYFIFLRAERSKREDYLLFTTLARDLSDRYPSFKTALGKAIKDNKSLRAAQDYHTLFEFLLLRPLKDVHTVGPILIIIDALDESGDATGRSGLHIFLAERLAKLPSNFRILITSRLETDITLPFVNGSETFEIVHMDDSELAASTDGDIRLYLQKNLPPDTFKQYGNELVKKGEGLFQWAAVACGYISYPPPGLTKNDCIRGLLKPSANHKALGQALGPLYNLYKQVLEGYFEARIVKDRFRSVIGQLLAAFEPLSIHSLTALRRYPLGDRDDDDSVIAIVRHLGSLLSNATSSDQTLPIVPLHTSFRDFLTDEQMSGAFYIDLGEAHRQLAHSCLGIMLHDLKFNICDLESSYFPNSKVSDLPSRINKHILPGLFYACRFWDDHLERLHFEQVWIVNLRSFFEQKFLFWLEVLSLTSTVDLATPALLSLKAWLTSGDHNEACRNELTTFQELVTDAFAFLRYFGMVIAESAPHIYISALPFAPISSPVYRNYCSLFPNTLSVKRGRLSHWPTVEMVIPVEGTIIRSVAFSQDGQRIVSGSSDGTIRVWNATTGAMEGSPFTGHNASVNSVAFSQDGQQIVSGSSDSTICVWNATTGAMEGSPFTGHNGWVNSVAFSQDGEWIVSGSSDGTIRVWNTTMGAMEGSPFTGHNGSVGSVAFMQDGQRIVSGSSDGTIRVWNTTTGAMEGSPFTGHTDYVRSVAFSQDGQRIVSGSSDGTIRVWNATTGAMEGSPFTGHNGWVNSVAFSQDGRRIVSGSSDGTICVWNATMGAMEGSPFTGHNGSVGSVVFSQDGQRIVSGSDDHTIRVWNATTGAMEGSPFTGHNGWVNSVAFSQDGQRIVSGSSDGTIRVWSTPMGAMEGSPFTGHNGSVNSVAFSQDGQWIVSGSDDRTIRMWNATMGAMEGRPFTGHTDYVRSVAFSQDGQRIVSGSSDGTIRVWNAMMGAMEGSPFTGHNGWVNSVAFSQDGQQIVSGSSDGTICVWNATTGVVEGGPFTGHSGWVNSVAFSQDGQRIVSGSSDCTIRAWSATAAEQDKVDFTDQSMINSGGWICGSRDELLLWVPLIHRLSLYRPSNIWIAGGHDTQLDLSRFVHGPNWATHLNN